MVVLVPGERQSVALDRVGDEAGRGVGLDAVEGLEDRLHVVPGQVGHQRVQAVVIVLVEQRGDPPGRAQVAQKPGPPAGAAAVDQGRIQRVGAVVDPVPQRLAAGPRERLPEPLAVLQGHDVPAHRAEGAVDPLEEPVLDHAVEALAVVVDDPPDVADVVLPAFEEGLEDIPLVELGVADQRDHPAGRRVVGDQPLEPEVVLDQRGEQRDRDPQADRAGREVDVVTVLGPRRVRLRAAEGAESLELLAALPPQQVLDGVEDGAGVGLDRDPVLGPQDVEVEPRHERHQRGARRLVPPHLQPVALGTQVVGVVDHPRREPEHLPLQRAEACQTPRGQRLDQKAGAITSAGGDIHRLVHGDSPKEDQRPRRLTIVDLTSTALSRPHQVSQPVQDQKNDRVRCDKAGSCQWVRVPSCQLGRSSRKRSERR